MLGDPDLTGRRGRVPAQSKSLINDLPSEDMMDVVVVKKEELKFHDEYLGSASISCTATAQAVYDLLADLRTHVVWGGQHSGMHQRLLTLEIGRASCRERV